MLGKIEGGRRRGQQKMRQLDGITDSMNMSLSKLRELVIQGSLAHYSLWGLDWTDADPFLLKRSGIRPWLSCLQCVLPHLQLLVIQSRSKVWHCPGRLRQAVCHTVSELSQHRVRNPSYYCRLTSEEACPRLYSQQYNCDPILLYCLPREVYTMKIRQSILQGERWEMEAVEGLVVIHDEQRNWTELMVQWVGIRLSTQGTWLRSPVWEDLTDGGAVKPIHHNC